MWPRINWQRHFNFSKFRTVKLQLFHWRGGHISTCFPGREAGVGREKASKWKVMKKEDSPRLPGPLQNTGTAHSGAGFIPDDTSVPPSFLPLYLFRDSGFSSKLWASWEQCCEFCDHRASTVPSTWPVPNTWLWRNQMTGSWVRSPTVLRAAASEPTSPVFSPHTPYTHTFWILDPKTRADILEDGVRHAEKWRRYGMRALTKASVSLSLLSANT